MKIKKCFLIGLIVGIFSVSSTVSQAKYHVSAKAAIFSNSTQVIRYYGKNVHTRVRPASTVKVMTALVVLENLALDKVVTVSQRATYPQPSKIYVKKGERYKVRDLLYAILLKSANDASVVLAEAVSGSESDFVELMNLRAKQLGAHHTKFVNPNGLPSSRGAQYTTPYDMYLIFREALKHPFFKQAVTYKYKKIRSLSGRKITLKSHNKILFKNWKQKLFGKTGWTRKAKSCFVGYTVRGKEKDICIIALFGASRRWRDIKHIVERYGLIDL
jgi:D-alanyl-D-alanine carboxypeptidase (penicillin-binding protein 5/6)